MWIGMKWQGGGGECDVGTSCFPLWLRKMWYFLETEILPLLKVPNLRKELGIAKLFIKDESMNPTGSFKASGLAFAVSKAKELGIRQ